MKYKALMLLGFILSHLGLTAADTVTTHQYQWDEGSNTSIAIPSNFSKNFCITFEANPKNDFHIGLYSETYTRVLDESGAYIQSKEATPLASGARNTLSAIVEFCYGGWGNVQSALRIDYMNTRSARSQETMIPDVKIPEANRGVFRTYTVTVTLTQSAFKMVFAYLDPTTNAPVVIRTITQADLALSSGGVLAESTFSALQKATFQGFTKLGFLVYDTTYTVKNWTITAPIETSTTKAIEEKTTDVKIDAEKVITNDAKDSVVISKSNVTSYFYTWEDGKNLSLPVPAEYKNNFCLTFEANPHRDLDIGLYSKYYKRSIDGQTIIRAKEESTDRAQNSLLLSAIVELAYGGWNNTKSAVFVEAHSKRSGNFQLTTVTPDLFIPAQDVGIFKTYQVTALLTKTSFSFTLSVQDTQSDVFRSLLSISHTELPPATTSGSGESVFTALQKLIINGFTEIGFVGYDQGYEVKNWRFTPLIDTEAKAAAEKAEADRLAAEKASQEKAQADRLAAEQAAADAKAIQDKADADTKATEAKAAAEKAEADRLAAEKASQEKAQAERLAAEQAAADAKAIQEKAAADAKAAQEKAEVTRLAAEKAAQEKVAAEKAAADAAAKTKTAVIPSLSLGDLKRQAAVTKQYDRAKINLQTTLTKALEGQKAALAATTSVEKITDAKIKKPLQKDAAQLAKALDDYVAKITKAQNTLASTPPPFNTPMLITRGQKNADNAAAYASTALTLTNQRIKSIESLQKKIDKAVEKK